MRNGESSEDLTRDGYLPERGDVYNVQCCYDPFCPPEKSKFPADTINVGISGYVTNPEAKGKRYTQEIVFSESQYSITESTRHGALVSA